MAPHFARSPLARMWLPALVLAPALAACEADDGTPSAPEEDPTTWQYAITATPLEGSQGGSLLMDLDASQSIFRFGTTELDLGEGVTASVTVWDGFTAEAEIVVAPDAEVGCRPARLTVDGRDATLRDPFCVTDTRIALNPDSAVLGEVVEVALLGTNTNWNTGEAWVSFGDAVDVLDFTVLSTTLASARVAVRGDGVPGARDVTVETPDGASTLYDGFTVDRAVIGGRFEPVQAYQGETVDFALEGVNTSWGPDAVIEFWDDGGPNPDIQLRILNWIDEKNMNGRIRLSNAARVGYRDVYIESGDQAMLIPDAIEVLDAAPELDRVAVGTSFDVARQVDNGSCDVLEQVSAQAYFLIPLDPPCGASPPPAMGPQPYDANGVFPSPPPPEPVDCPSPETVDAGDYVWYESEQNIVTLEKEVIESTGQIIYVGRDLTLDDYGFGQVYDLHLQGVEPGERGLPEEIIPDVQPTVPADFSLVEPAICEGFTWNRENTFNYRWTPAMTYPNAVFSTQISGQLEGGQSGFAGSIPWDDGLHAYTPRELLRMASGPVTFSASSYIEGPTFGLRGNVIQSNQSDSTVSISARMTLE